MTPAQESLYLDVERIAAGGDGVAHADGMVVFVPRTAVGDKVRARISRHKRFARGRVELLIARSRDRVEPACPHYTNDDCGGCQLQHLTYDAQLRAKSGMVRDAIDRIGKRGAIEVAVEPSPKPWRYRNKLTLAIRKSAQGAWVTGLHPFDDPVGVFQLNDCPITMDEVIAVWREVMGAHELYPAANELRASVQVNESDCVVVMEGGSSWPKRSEFFHAVPSASALWWKRPHERRQLVATRADRDLTASSSFAQVNRDVAASLRGYVVERIMGFSPRRVVDGYAGTGAATVELAASGIEVTAIELDRDASARCASQIAPPSKAIAGRVEDLLPQSLPADVVLLNPPRTGLDAKVAETLQAASPAPAGVVYVSCDPATLGRDLARMPRYAIASLRSFDMFPQTAHVETVCELRLSA